MRHNYCVISRIPGTVLFISGKLGEQGAPPDFEIENQFVYFVRLRSDRHIDVLTIILFPIILTAKTNNSITVIVSFE